MLFVLIMDVLNDIIGKADEKALLQPLATTQVKHRVSRYVDDVALFILHPSLEDLSTTKEILHLFGEANGLCVLTSKRAQSCQSIVPLSSSRSF